MNKIGLAPTSLPNTPALEYIAAASEAGFEAVGMRLFRSPGLRYAFDPVAGDADKTRDVKHALANSGVELLEVLSYYLQPDMDLDSMAPSLELAAELGARYALVIGDDPEWSRMVDNFGQFCDHIAPMGMVAAIEAPVFRRVLCSIPLTVRLIVDSRRTNAAICLDPLHFVEVGHTPDDLKGLDARLFPYTQIRDGHVVNRLGSRFWRDEPHATGALKPGEGQVPLTEILDILPVGLPLSLEWAMPSRGSYSPAEWAKEALEGTRQFLAGYYASRSARHA
ncbi:MAG: sugar phosphate isomerase/epimerase [Chloroflexi bacterium]|nr:sugar phosphate isomerase/epimerase [Chloroflexota bacterium]